MKPNPLTDAERQARRAAATALPFANAQARDFASATQGTAPADAEAHPAPRQSRSAPDRPVVTVTISGAKITPEAREYIRAHWGQVSTVLMGRRLGVSSTTVSAVAHKMGCPRLARGYEGFVPTPEQADYIRDNWGSLTLRAIARHVGVSYEAVRRAGREMGLPQLKATPRPVMAARVATKPVGTRPAEPRPLPVIESDFIRPPTKAQLMAGR